MAKKKPETPKPKATTAPKKTASAAMGITTTTVVQMLSVKEIQFDDTTYRFRANLRTGPLKDSLKAHGQQVPVIVLKREGNTGPYQLISGFRRLAAIRELGWDEIAAIERDLTDEEAFRASVLENTARKTYSDVDRAYAIREYKERGYSSRDIGEEVMGLSKRQINNLHKLLELPQIALDAIDDPEQYFTTTHALTLNKLAAKYPEVDWQACITLVNDEQLPVARLIRAVNKDYRTKTTPEPKGLFMERGTDPKKGLFRFAPVKIDVASLSPEAKTKLRSDLESILAQLV